MTEPRRIVLPPPTPDQLAYLEQIHRACTEYDGSQVVGGPRPHTATAAEAAVVRHLEAVRDYADPCSCQHPGESFHERGSMVCLHEPRDVVDCAKCRALDPQGVFLCPEHSKAKSDAIFKPDERVAATLDRFAGWSFEPDLDAPAPRPTDEDPVADAKPFKFLRVGETLMIDTVAGPLFVKAVEPDSPLVRNVTDIDLTAFVEMLNTLGLDVIKVQNTTKNIGRSAEIVLFEALSGHFAARTPGDDICMNGRLFLRELATVMGVIEPTADPDEVLPISEVMPKMLARALEDREKWHQPPVNKVTYIAPPGYVLVPQIAIDWLDGAAADDEGKWFGDREEEAAHRGPHSVKRPMYWFRSAFRRIIDRVGPPRHELVAARPSTRVSFANDLDYLQQADAHRDEGTLGERAARSILDIALHWCHVLKSQQEVHATKRETGWSPRSGKTWSDHAPDA